jgi:tetratricopeptide (TPR) repeat protein
VSNREVRKGPMGPAARLYLNAGLRFGAALAGLLWVSPTSAADPSADEESGVVSPTSSDDSRAVLLNEEGAAFYATRDYRRAVERFIQALAIDNDPNLLFNIASCYEKLGDTDAAIEKYRAFLNSPDPDPAGRARAEKAIAALSQASSPELAPLAVEDRSPQVASLPASRGPATEPRWLPWATLGGGAVLTAAGATIYLLGAADHARVTGARGFGDGNAVADMTLAEADDLVDSGKTKKWIGGTGLAIGGALMTSYLVYWLLDDAAPENPTLDVGPTLEGGAFMSWSGAF